MTKEELKQIVKDKYSQIAKGDITVHAGTCCGATPKSKEVYNIMNDSYEELGGYTEDADLGLGCGLPTEFAMIKTGDTVLDLGSGAGNDAFVARHETGVDGKVIGVDFSPEMVAKARKNAEKLGYNNVEFRSGDIEDMPVADSSVDVVVSNCVLNLLPEKSQIFHEIFRVLKPSGHFSISDIVLIGDLPAPIVADAEMYAGCVSGAIQKEEYINLVKEAGFNNLKIQKEKEIIIPDDILNKYLDPSALAKFKSSETGIYSITLFATKGEENKTAMDLSDLVSEGQSCVGPGCC